MIRPMATVIAVKKTIHSAVLRAVCQNDVVPKRVR